MLRGLAKGMNKSSWRSVTEADLAETFGRRLVRPTARVESAKTANRLGRADTVARAEATLTQVKTSRRFDYADTLNEQLRVLGLPEPIRDYRFDAKEHGGSGRRWLMDLAWPDLMVSCEVDGGEWSQGKHSRGLGMQSNCEKLNAALLAGWRPYRFTGSQVTSGYALNIIEKALGAAPALEKRR